MREAAEATGASAGEDSEMHPLALAGQGRLLQRGVGSSWGLGFNDVPEDRGRAEPRPWLLTPRPSSRYDEGSGGSGDEGRDEAHKRQWNLFYQKQMSLRKVKVADTMTGLSGSVSFQCCDQNQIGKQGLHLADTFCITIQHQGKSGSWR